MQGLLRILFCTTLLHAHTTLAATVFRCEDASGHITFTLQGCQNDQLTQLQSADNPTPGNGTPTPLASTAKPHQTKHKPKGETAEQADLVIVGEHNDGCGNQLSSTERRSAIIRQEIYNGMTRRDVESALGKPDKISSQNGKKSYQYRDEDGNSTRVSFDQHGCVKTKP